MTENTPAQTGDAASAAGSELQVPKYRLDEVTARLRQREEELAIKDQLYLQERQRQMVQNQNANDEINPADYGLDEQTGKAIAKMAGKIAATQIQQQRQVFEQQIGMLATRTEKAELLAKKGSGAAKYVDEVQQMQMRHARETGGFLPAELAFDLIKSKENEEKLRKYESGELKANQSAAASQGQASSGPPAAGTREIPGGGSASAGGSQQKDFGELSLAEMEARLSEHFSTGVKL